MLEICDVFGCFSDELEVFVELLDYFLDEFNEVWVGFDVESGEVFGLGLGIVWEIVRRSFGDLMILMDVENGMLIKFSFFVCEVCLLICRFLNDVEMWYGGCFVWILY